MALLPWASLQVLKAPPEEAVCSALNVDFSGLVSEKPNPAKLNNDSSAQPAFLTEEGPNLSFGRGGQL
jgi:hypothetical protein